MHLTIDQRLQRLQARLVEMSFWRYREHVDLDDWKFDGEPFALGAPWPRIEGAHILSHDGVELPGGWSVEETALDLDLGGEALLTVEYVDGRSESFGLDPFHQRFTLASAAFSLSAEIVARLPLGVPNRAARLERARLVRIDDGVQSLYRLLALVVQSGIALGDDVVVEPMVSCAERAVALLEWPSATASYVARTAPGEWMQSIWALPNNLEEGPPGLDELQSASVVRATAQLQDDLVELRRAHAPRGRLAVSGHAHLDLAWLWPMEETRRKATRTFHTVMGLINRYPELTFNQSSAQLYAFLEEDDPQLFQRIEKEVAAGVWEPVGGMWVEPDANMPAGESLVRQLLYGQRYFQTRFGSTHKTCWLPDCFGFTPALPQVLLGAGIENFFTHKLNWSETNEFPYDLFWWEGIDGSRVLAHGFHNPEGGYNGDINPATVTGTWRNFRGKALHEESLLTVGYGDGAGGPTAEMVERARQLKCFPALPEVRFTRVQDFYDDVRSGPDGGSLPAWVGELYFELHRGTLTSQGRLKYLHRRAERDLVAAEVLGCLSALLGNESPESLEESWRVLLRNEFHDILPGSSVREVNETAELELANVVRQAGDAVHEHLKDLGRASVPSGGKRGLLVVNPDLSTRPIRIETDHQLEGAQAVDEGYVVTSEETILGLEARVLLGGPTPAGLDASPTKLENDLVAAHIGEDGAVSSVWDKVAGREALAGRGNQIWAYVDKPRAWDAWDIDAGYADDGTELVAGAIELVESGPHRAAIRIDRHFRDSVVTQEVRLWCNSARIDFATSIDWRDRHWLVKSRWPLAVRAARAAFETAFGVVERPTHRNTSWDAAQFEVAGHRFADLSEPGYGVALLNDGRYGHHALGNELGLSLLRAPAYSDPLADEGSHSFTYALFPHAGSWLEGGVLAEAEDLNRPLPSIAWDADGPVSVRPLQLKGVHLGLGALKAQEDGDGLVLRVYEPAGARGALDIDLPEGWTLGPEVNLLEEETGEPDLHFTPFKIRTYLLRRN